MTKTLNATEQNDAFALGVCQVDRDRMLAFLKRLSTALYSSDFTEPLGQYRTEMFYEEAKTLIKNCERSIAEHQQPDNADLVRERETEAMHG